MRLALVACVWLFPAAGTRADDLCIIVRILAAADMSTRAILAAPDALAAARPVHELEARLDRIGAHLAHIAGSDAAHAALAGPMGRFIDSRRRLVALYRSRGLAAARAHMLEAEFLAARQAVGEVLRRYAGCLPPGERPVPPEAAAPPEFSTGGEQKTPGDAPARPLRPVEDRWVDAAARHEAPPPKSIWLGIAVLVALGLMLIAAIVFDSTERRGDPRFACHLPGRLRVRGADRRVVIVEISRGGAKLWTAERFAVGERGVLVLLGVPTVFKVVWATPSFCGIAFRRKLGISAEELARLSVPEPQQDPHAPSVAAE